MRKFVINVNGKSYEVEVEEIKDGIQAAAPVQSAQISKPAVNTAAPKQTGSAGSFKIESPMPGNILKLNVKAGDKVEKGQTVAILEAMKMENDIVSPNAGTVASVNVSVGDSINTGDVIITLN
ncbi:MAG: biotin/lipoyl-binding protein [Clostridia bacterium]|nr:biotin/lipoyl-binding protein [Clostridia bacterium]